jgi:hypothetical protein
MAWVLIFFRISQPLTPVLKPTASAIRLLSSVGREKMALACRFIVVLVLVVASTAVLCPAAG